MHWPFVMGDETAEPDTTLVDACVYLETENPILDVHCFFICVQHGVTVPNDGRANVESLIIVGGEKKVTMDDALYGRALWDISFDLEQLDNVAAGVATWATNATSFASVTLEDQALTLHPATAAPSGDLPPVLRWLGWAQEGYKGTDRKNAFCYKEGHLFQEEGDFAVLQYRKFRLATSGMTDAETLKPFRLRLSAQHANPGNDQAAERKNDYLDPFDAGAPEAGTRLVLVSCTVIERPTR
jgi:hypothetical protein